jgi:hypothetical protein
MSKNSNLVGEIKSLMVKFGFLKSDFAKLIDGTEIKVEGDELKEGAAVLVVTEEGNVPAPDGIHELEDGTKVETVEGLIKSIELPAAMEENIVEESPEGEEEVEMEEEVVEVEVPAEVPAEVAAPAVEAIVEAIVPILKHVKDLEEELKKMKASFETFRNQPAGSPVNKTKKDFKVQDADEMVGKILALKNANR